MEASKTMASSVLFGAYESINSAHDDYSLYSALQAAQAAIESLLKTQPIETECEVING